MAKPLTDEERMISEEAARLLGDRAFLRVLQEAEREVCKAMQRLDGTEEKAVLALHAELRAVPRLLKVLQMLAGRLRLDSDSAAMRVTEGRLDV